MSKPRMCEVDGVRYVAEAFKGEDFFCHGCAGQDDDDLCESLGPCCGFVKPIIWVRADKN